MSKKTKHRDDDYAARLRELDEERAELLEKINNWKEECAERSAKPEEVDPLFCSVEEPCEQTATMTTLEDDMRKAWREYQDKEIDVLFCSTEEKDCKQVMWKYSSTPGVEKDEDFVVPVTEVKLTYWARVIRYISKLWQEKISFGT